MYLVYSTVCSLDANVSECYTSFICIKYVQFISEIACAANLFSTLICCQEVHIEHQVNHSICTKTTNFMYMYICIVIFCSSRMIHIDYEQLKMNSYFKANYYIFMYVIYPICLSLLIKLGCPQIMIIIYSGWCLDVYLTKLFLASDTRSLSNYYFILQFNQVYVWISYQCFQVLSTRLWWCVLIVNASDLCVLYMIFIIIMEDNLVSHFKNL
jgi:hypothetical protein